MIARSKKQVTAIRLIEKHEFIAEILKHFDSVDLFVGNDFVKVNEAYVPVGGYYIIEDEEAMTFDEFHKNYELC